LVALALIIGGAYFLNILLVLHQIASCWAVVLSPLFFFCLVVFS
jgi:hypothetical protein